MYNAHRCVVVVVVVVSFKKSFFFSFIDCTIPGR